MLFEQKKVMLSAGKWMELKNIVLSEVSHVEDVRGPMLSLIC
jgi:hypothetical protein